MSADALTADELLREAEAALRLEQLDEARELYYASLDAAPDTGARADALAGLGNLAYRNGRPREAVELLEQSIGLRGGAFWEHPELAETLGRSYGDLGELERAKLVFEECRRRAKREQDRVNEVRFACLVGYALTDRGKFDEAERALQDVLDAGAGVDDALTRARLHWAQARLRGEQGQTERALQHARAALEIVRQNGRGRVVAVTHQLVASLLNDLGRSDDALAHLREGRGLLADATPIEAAHFRIEEARALAAQGERERAAKLAAQAAEQLGGARPGDAGRAYVLLGEIFEGIGELDRAHELYEQGITLLEGQGPSRYLAAAYKRLGELFESQYRTRDALSVLKRALAVQERVSQTAAPAAEA